MQIAQFVKYQIKPKSYGVHPIDGGYELSFNFNDKIYHILTRRGQPKIYKTYNALFSDLEKLDHEGVPLYLFEHQDRSTWN